MSWTFTPYNLNEWNKSNRRVLFVAPEPNGNNPNGNVQDMGNWFRTASEKNAYSYDHEPPFLSS